ncbi:unnamed protein product [Clavelina lepadiformis]|uniref:Uncharacterized protein n=1 Tax=Clavelina lepadiformis TaxID=159417 RepID=A0ABP0G4G9_CLALP
MLKHTITTRLPTTLETATRFQVQCSSVFNVHCYDDTCLVYFCIFVFVIRFAVLTACLVYDYRYINSENLQSFSLIRMKMCKYNLHVIRF